MLPFVMTPANGYTFKSFRIRNINRTPVSQKSNMFISSLWDVKEPAHYSRREGDEVPGLVAVLYECMGGWVGIMVHIS